MQRAKSVTDLKQELEESYPAHVEYVVAANERALQTAGADWVVVPSGSLREAFLDDYTYNFVANPHFKHWLPLTGIPDCAIIFRRGERPVLMYHQPRDFWYQPPSEPSGYWVDHFDIRIVDSPDQLVSLMPADRQKAIVIGDHADLKNFNGIDRINPAAALNVLHNARTYKTEYELACMREAQRMATTGHAAAEAAFQDERSEYDIHEAYCTAMRQREIELPYNSIVALNAHASILHYQNLERQAPRTVGSFLIDAGASCNGYAADITRSYSASDGKFQSLIDAMDELQLGLVANVKPGIDFRALHLTAHRQIAHLLVASGIASASAAELIDKRITCAFFPHGLGHYLGLQVHDVAGLASGDEAHPIARPRGHDSLRLTRQLETDQVVTIEPGIYFIPMLLEPLRAGSEKALLNWPLVDELIPYGGIRVEDDVRVIVDGAENLTRPAFDTLKTR